MGVSEPYPGTRATPRSGARGGLAGSPRGARSRGPGAGRAGRRRGWRRRAPYARHMGRLTEAAAAARSAGPPPTPLPISATSPGCAATMASSEEDGTNGGASEAGEEREATGKRRRLGWVATAWLTFYNIAMTAGYVRPEGRRAPSGPPRAAVPRSSQPGAAAGRRGAPGSGGAQGRVPSGASGGSGRRGRAGGGRGGGARVEWSGAGGRALLAWHCLIRCTAGRGPEVKYRPGQECGADPRGRRLRPGSRGRRCCGRGCRNAGCSRPRFPGRSRAFPRVQGQSFLSC